MIYIRKGAYDCVVSIQNNVPENEITEYGWIIIDEEADMDGEQYLHDKLSCTLYDDELRPNVKYISSLEKFTNEEKEEYFNTEIIQTDPISLEQIKEELENKADKITVLNEDGSEVKKIDLGFKMLEEEGNVTKGQLLDRDTKGVLYPETTTERVIGLDDIINNGGRLSTGNEFHGATGDYGLEVDYIKGAYKQVETKGYQLFDSSKYPSIINKGGATVVKNEDGSFTFSGGGTMNEQLNSAVYFSHEDTIKLLKEGTLYLVDTPSNLNQFIEIALFGTNSKLWLNLRTDQDKLTGTVTAEMLNDEKLYLSLYLRLDNGKTITPGTIYPMLYQDGDGTFEPFTGGQPSPNPEYKQEPEFTKIENFYTSGKNFFNFSEESVTNKSSNLMTEWNGNSLTYYMTDSGNSQLKFNLKLKAGTYYMNKPFSEGTQFRKGSVVVLNQYTFGGKIVLNSDVDNIILNFANTETPKTISDLMLSLGDTAQPYTPFVGSSQSPTSIELRALPNGVCDTYENGVITRRVGKIVLNGNERWNTDGSVKNYYYTSVREMKKYGIALCDKALYLNSLGGLVEGKITTTNVLVIGCDKNKINSASEFKEWIKENPYTVYYELATPTTEYLALPTLPSYYPYTNAWHDATVEPTEMRYRVKSYDALLEQNKFVEEDYIKLTETDDMVSTSSNRGGAELLYMEGAYEQVKTNGYQLFDASKLPTKSQGGVTVTNNGDGSFTITGTTATEYIVGQVTLTHEETVKLLKAGTITLKVDKKTVPLFGFGLLKATSGTYFQKNLTSEITEISAEITQDMLNDSESKFFYYWFANQGNTIIQGTVKPMLYQDGDGEWEQFTGGKPSPNPNYPQEPQFNVINDFYTSGKNLFNVDGMVQLASESGFSSSLNKTTFNEKNCLYVNSSKSSFRSIIFLEKELSQKTQYVLNFSVYSYTSEQTGNGIAVVFKYTDGTTQSITCRLKNEFQTITMTSQENKTVGGIYFSYGVYSIGYIDIDNSFIVKYGDEEKYYPYQGSTTPFPLLLRALPNGTKDIYENGVLTRRVGEAVFDGSSDEQWTMSPQPTVNNYAMIALNDGLSSGYDYTKINLLCNRFLANNSNIDSNLMEDYICRYGSSSGGRSFLVKLPENEFQTVEEWKEYLQSHQTIIYYLLATPTVETIDKPFIETYYPWTNIWHDSEVKSHMKIGFKNRFGEFYTKKEVDELIKNAIATIGTQMIK